MSGGGGFRGRGFATRGHRRQGFDGSGGSNARANRHDSRGGTAGLQGPMGSRSGFRGVGSRSIAQSDGTGPQGGVGLFRGDGIGGPRKNFNSPRGPPVHQIQQPDGNWSGNNWSANNWTDKNTGNNWSDNNLGNNWANNDCANNWSDNNPGNHWSDNNPGNNWADNNLGNNWSANNPCNTWSLRGARPPRGGFPAWGAPTRFNSPPIPPFYRSPGQNNFGPYGFPPPVGTNYLPPPVVDFPLMPDTEPQNTQKLPSNAGPKTTHPKKPSKPEKQIIHPGSEEERLQKITEAADKLKRTLSTIKKAPETWYNDDDGGALEFSQQDPDHEPRIANRGIPELKHDPPELDLTLNDLRDIGRVDHDHTVRSTKSSNDPDQNIDEPEVEILEHSPVQRVPEATIDIDLWPEDNPQISTLNQFAETSDIIEASNDLSEPSQTFLDSGLRTDNDHTVSNPKKLDSQCNDETSVRESNKQQNGEEISRDPDQLEEEKTIKENPQNINLDSPNSESCPSSKSDQKTTIDDDFLGKTKNTQSIKIEMASARDTKPKQESTASNKSQGSELSTNIENVQIVDDLQNYANYKTAAAFAVTDQSKETSNEAKIFNEIGSIHDERIETRDCVPTRESWNDKIVSLVKPESAKIPAGAPDEVTTDEGAENSQEKLTIKSDKVASSDDGVQNENEIYKSCRKSADALEETSDEANPVKRDENIIETTSESVSKEETMNATVNQSESKTKEKERSTDKSYSRSQSNDRDSIEIRGNVNANIDPETGKKVTEPSLASRDLDIGEHRQEESPKMKPESKKLQERSQTPSGPEVKSQERRKLIRTAYNNFCSINRKSTPDPAEKNASVKDCESSMEDGASANAAHNRIHRNQSALSSNFEKSNNASSSSGKRPKEESSPALMKLNRRLQSMVEAEDPVQSVLPPAFDPRLSSRERSVLMSSSMPIQQDFTIASGGYPSRTMTNLVPSSVAAMNYVVPVGVPPPASTAIKPTSKIPPICIPDSFVPILPLASVPIVPPMVLPNELMLQPPLPVELPPPPPPPQKQAINMEAELEDMQEAMEFAKQLMNMNDSMEPAPDDLLDADIPDESGFFHMPTFPDLPPIELPPAPLPAEMNPMKNIDAKEQPANKECRINLNRGSKTYGPAVMPEEYRGSPVQPENTVEISAFTEEQLRPKVVFNLNARSKIINKHDDWHHQAQREKDSEISTSFVATTAKKIVTEISENRKTTTNPASPMLGTKERSRTASNGHEDRKKRDERARSTRYNGKIDSARFSRSNKSVEDSTSRSPTPPKHGTQAKSAKRDDECPRYNRAKKSDAAERSGKETTRKSGNDPQTPESSWKSRVIGRFLKMSKNDIGNMLNNASLRKFDIAMKHLVKERRSSLSLGMRNTEEERMKDAELTYNREEFMDQLSAMLDPSATVDVCNLPTQFIHHLSEVLHLDTMSEFDSSRTISETLGDVSSPATQSSPNSESRKQLESRDIASARQADQLYEKNPERKRRRGKLMGGPEIATTMSPGTSLATTPTGPLETWKVSRAIEKPTAGENSRTESVENHKGEAGPRSKRRRVRGATSEQQSTMRGNGSLTENDSSSLNMADLDDIFSAGIARAKKKSHDLPILASGGGKRDEELPNVEENIVPMAKDPSIDRVERAVVELDEIFTAGIARAKLASKKGSETVKPVEMFVLENDERVWNPGSLRASLDSHRIREKSSPSGKKASKLDKWSRHVHYEEPVAYRNLTKEEWEAKYSEPSYSTYQREYRAMEALREERSRHSPSYDGKLDYNAFDINDLGSVKSRLGEPVTAAVGYHEDWSGSDELSRGRDIDEAMNYTVDCNRNSGVESSSPSSGSSSSSSDNEDNEASTLSVTKLLKVIKEREKIAKQKSFNEEIRDEVTAEIERQKREREKLRKRHRPKGKRSSHQHRRKKDKRGKVRERKKRDRKRKKRKSRRSDGSSKGSSDDEVLDEEYFSSSSRGRHSSRLLNENEIKKEIKQEPDASEAGPTEKTTAKSCTSSKSPNYSQPASTTYSSSIPSIVALPSAPRSVAHQTKTKAQLKQMPAVVKKRVATVTNVNEETAKNQPAQANEDTRENIVTNSSPVDAETPNVPIESDNPTIPSVPTVTTPATVITQTSAASDETPIKTNSKKLDIKTYKERARQRQLIQNEKIRLLSENPSSLTQNLLSIPVTRKKELEPIETNVNEPPRDPRLNKVEQTSVEMSFDEKLNNETPTTPVVCASSATAKISTSSNTQENVPPPEVVRKKITRPPLTPAQPSKEPQPVAKDPPADPSKFSHIKSEGRKEMKLREKLKRGCLRTSLETSETSGPPKVPPTRLNRRRSLVATEKILVATELKTNQVPSTSVLDATSTSPNSETLEPTKTSNETPNSDDKEKILSASETSNSVESFDRSENVATSKTPEPPTNLNESQSFDISKPPMKSLDEPKIPDNLDTLNETVVSSSADSNTPDAAESFVTPESTSTSVALTKIAMFSTTLGAAEIFDGPRSRDTSKSPDDSEGLDSWRAESLENPTVPIEPNTWESVNFKEELGDPETLDPPRTLTNLRDSVGEEFSENSKAPQTPTTLENPENGEIPRIVEGQEAPSKESEKPDGESCLEQPTGASETAGNSDDPETSNLLEKLMTTEKLAGSKNQDPVSMPAAIEKDETILTNETELIALEMPIEELADWSLDAPAISSNIPESFDYSNDSVPFKGFTEEAILRRDRVLTEAEITEDSELNTFESVPLNFVSEGATRTAGNMDLEEITSTDVVDSLDSLPLTYSEQFPNPQDEIDASLPDPLGHTIFTVASEIVDDPVAMSLEPLQAFAADEVGEKACQAQDQPMDVERPAGECNEVETLTSVHDFLVDDVNTRETVPSPILVPEANGSKEPSVAEPTKSTSDEDDKVNATSSPSEMNQEATLFEESSTEQTNVEKPVPANEPRLSEAENCDANAVAVEKNIRSDMEPCSRAPNGDNDVERSEVPDVDLEAESTKEIEATESSQKSCEVKVDDIEQSVSGTNEEAAKEEEAGSSPTSHQEKLDPAAKSKDSPHHSRDHSHGKVKKKSSRYHNHGSKTSKRTTLTEKLVEDAITANVVKLVAKPNSRQTVMARMMEIDVEIHKLMNEKMTLYKMLESGDFTSAENQDCVDKIVDETNVVNEKEKEAEAGQVKSSMSAIPKATEELTKKPETKSPHSEVEDKTKKRKKSPHRESKHRSREPDSAQPRRERKRSESKSHTLRITLSEETTRQESGPNCSREKSTSWTDLEDAEDRRRKKEETSTHKSSKRYDQHSSKEDLLEVPRDSNKAEKSTKSDSAKRQKSKKSKKSESRWGSREGQSAPEKGTTANSGNIYSDDSNLELQEPHDSTKNQEASGNKDHVGGSTGLTLLEESLKREKAHHRKIKTVEKRKNKNHELRRSLLNATVLTASEAKTGLMNLFERRKLHRKENAASSGTKDKKRSRHPGKVSKHVSRIIDAVASNRVEELYTENSRAASGDDGTRLAEVQENRAVGDEGKEERIDREEQEQTAVPGTTDDLTSRIKKVHHPENVEESEQKESQEEKEDSNKKGLANREDSPVASEPEILEIPKTPDIAEEDVINFVAATTQKIYKSDAGLASRDESVKKSRTESRSEGENEQEKRTDVAHRSRSVTPEYPEPSSLNSKEQTNRRHLGQLENSDAELADETPGDGKRGVRIVEETTEKKDTLLDDEDDDEIIARSRSRAKARRTKRRGKSRSRTRKDRRSHHKDTRDSPSRRGYASDENDQEDISLRRPRSATSRNHKHREKAGPPSRRGSRQSEENVKRGRKREHERSNSRGLSPHDSEPSRKRSHSHRSVTPTILPTAPDQQSNKKGKKRKRPGEMSVEEMMRCKVELIDCKYTYLSPTMHPKILKKLGISRINRYVGPSKIIETWSPPILTRNETPSPPMLSKAFEAEYSRRELEDIIGKVEIPERLVEDAISTRKVVEEERMDDDEEEIKEVQVRSPIECLTVKDHVDDAEEEEEEEDDEDDDNIQIVKVLDDNLPITPQGHEDDDVRSVKDMDHDEFSRIDANENLPEVIAVEGDYDTTEEYEVIDEVTDETEGGTDETNDDVQVVDPSRARPPVTTENSTEPEELSEPDNNDNESEPRRTRYTVHKGPILDIKVLEDSFLAASEDGAIYRYSQTSNGILNIYKGHEAAVTCIYVLEMPGKRWNLYSGSLDGTFRCYDITTGAQDRSANIGSPVQCMDQGWGTIYIGTKSGHISRYSIKSTSLKGDRLEFSDKSVLALRASAEGPRRVLIVASRNQPITIRDANTGLFLRTICGYKNHTVYSLMRDRNLVYCGTSSTSIPVYDFTNGEQVTQYNAGVGIVCMRLYRQILFAGCYDGHIYVFDTLESKLLCSIPGPGNMLLSMEVVNDEIIAGSKNRQLHSWRMPKGVRALLAERT